MRRRLVIFGLGLAAALFAWTGGGRAWRGPGPSATASASRTAEPSAAAAPRRLIIGVRGDVASLNVYTAASAFDQEIADLLYPKLAYEQDDFQQGPPTFRPGLATSWDLSPDGKRLAFHSAARDGGYNYGRYSNPERDRLIDPARAESDPEAARSLWIAAQRIIARDQPYTFLFERDRLHAVVRNLRLPRMSPRSLYADLEEWSFEATERTLP